MCWEQRKSIKHAPGIKLSINNDKANPTDLKNRDYVILESDDLSVKYVCRWKLCLLVSLAIGILLSLIIFLIVYFAIIPHIAQKSVDYTTMDIVNGVIYNPTSNSMQMNTTIKIQNSGMFSATLSSLTTDVYNDDILIGTLNMPSITTNANKPTVITMSSILKVINSTQFQLSCKLLLQGYDQIWTLKSNKLSLSTEIMGITYHINNINLEKDLILPASPLLMMSSNDFIVLNATTTEIYTLSNIQYYTPSILTFILPSTLMYIYMNNIYIGYTPLDNMIMAPGINYINNTLMIVEKTADNVEQLQIFFSEYVMGKNQYVTLKGPISTSINDSLVIDNIFETVVLTEGSTSGDLAFGGLVTSETSMGWKVNDTNTTLRGAYANMNNPLTVPLKITSLSSELMLKKPLSYEAVLLGGFNGKTRYNCWINEPTYGFAYMNIGYGIYQNNQSINYVEVEALSKTTYFVNAGPQSSQKTPYGNHTDKYHENNSCLNTFPFSCCWAVITTAAICRDNPQLSNDKNSELTVDYIDTSLIANITVLIDNNFELTTYYYQEFFPLYFSYEVYAGYTGDFGLTCKDFTFY